MGRMAAPRVTYIIASTMRTGSYLLCEGLEATGIAGRPREIFCPERREEYTGRWNLPAGVTFEEFTRAAIDDGTTPNGVFGTKIHRHHVGPLARARGSTGESSHVLRDLFPNAKYLHLRRRDRRAQAISWSRAQQTNEWWRIAGVEDREVRPEPPQFHAPGLRRMELELERQQGEWDDFFCDAWIESLTLDYEALAADYRGEIARALAFLGEDPTVAHSLPKPRMLLQADALTEEWRRRMDKLFPL